MVTAAAVLLLLCADISPAAAARANSDGDAEKGKDEAGGGEGDAALKFDAGVAPVRPVVGAELEHGAFGVGEGDVFWPDDGGGQVDGNFALAEGGDVVMVGLAWVVIVLAALAKIQFDLIAGAAVDDLRVLRESDAGGRGRVG